MKRKFLSIAAIYLVSICFFIINVINNFPVVASLLYLIVIVMSSTFFNELLSSNIYVALILGMHCIGCLVIDYTCIDVGIYLFSLTAVLLFSYFKTLHKIKEERVAVERNQFQKIRFKNMMDAIFILEESSLRIVDCNDKALSLLNRKDGCIGKCIKECISSNIMDSIDLDNLEKYFEEGNEEIKVLGKKCNDFWIDMRIKRFHVEERRYLLLCISDITRHKKNEEEIEYLAYHDTLTNLPNRRYGDEKLQLAIKNTLKKKNMMSIMFVDVDEFKMVNDLLGHAAGDRLLQEVARRLQESVRKDDLVVRLGGDEFMIILENICFADEVIGIANRVIETFSQRFRVKGRSLSITCSIGIAVLPHHGTDVETLLEHADVAMYEAKRNGRNNFMIFNHELRDESLIGGTII
ncbi:GGDEF domain-containing protein [Marinisporobacter balticus]|uniref:Diguanylate cyclase (GGDEF)-like protein n=1 Tax=Marinisporobacter balticus TaxID=2018667 RepID=A0A4R2L176_9FIRM|nr:GGDEF domain-containing protein [Marinisporobacter balticus]TCO77466.1 diguanylate cyclase (GGDEF)-like protein [Marinisporobacter balticus]